MITSNRSDWSKLKPVADKLHEAGRRHSVKVEVDVVLMGSLVLQEFGDTKKIILDEYPNAHVLHTLVSGDSVGSMADSVGFGIIKVATLFYKLNPNVVLIHGDRFDALSGAVAANLLNLSIAHIEGGELSGTVVGTLRHAVTKLSHIHFACTFDAARRIRAMGDMPESIFVTGCPSYDKLFAQKSSGWVENGVEEYFAPFELRQGSFILALMHPITNDPNRSYAEYRSLMESLFEAKKKTILFYPNVDPGNKADIQILHEFQKQDRGWQSWLRVATHVPNELFMTLMQHASVMVGNSSAGIRESCVFGTPTLNLGNRQSGRRTPHNVTTISSPKKEDILRWFEVEGGKRYEPCSLYGHPDSSERIATALVTAAVDDLSSKSFWEPTYSLLTPPLQGIRQVVGNVCVGQLSSVRENCGNPKVLGLITARGGSKGIPMKNIVNLCGRPLIQYTIEAAMSAKCLVRVIVSTDSSEIADVARSCGCEVPFMSRLS